MPRDAVTVATLAESVAITNPAGTTIVPANDANIANVSDSGRVLVRVTNTHGSAHDVVFKAGDFERAALGDLTVNVPLTSGDKIVVLESARFVKEDGSIDVDFETDHAGKISAVRLPR